MFRWLKRNKPVSHGPDYSRVDTRQKAEDMVARGELVKMWLLPKLFGGEDVQPNVVYVPPFVADLKQGTDENTIGPLAADGKVSRYSATPRYLGNSFVPCSIEIQASEPIDFRSQIRIWGDALSAA